MAAGFASNVAFRMGAWEPALLPDSDMERVVPNVCSYGVFDVDVGRGVVALACAGGLPRRQAGGRST